ncbi:GNAT family N-acetyltransferase [Jiella sp. MQZ9-1]|uniref:GNAT family N-acetyltransferase n=1 Tax=Jiella flava TaxID=2816857 RepID=A0A939JUX0_9HYPH|nr:GNAT family N-acetyltransferase [Jiella flava]MBO0661402.1 GNAT family N-acetyltransferase [Jiella flava]MCD2470046.1 GNAT family N-acetyltransferase [Jiella flava]
MRLIRTRVTSLEMYIRPNALVPMPEGGGTLAIAEARQMPVAEYRTLYRRVGAAHHWTSRLVSDDRLKREIHSIDTRIFVMTVDGRRAGWFELDVRRAIGEVRIVHFGLLPEFRGRGLAHVMLSRAIWSAFASGPKRVTIETNTLDHPAALGLYQKHGFRPYAVRDVQTPAIESLQEPMRALT